jgi:hypothetical protein
MVNVFSFCLYGHNPKYTLGMIENVKIINDKFKDWKIYIYYNNVPENILQQLELYNNVVLIISTYTNHKTMLDRFKPLDNIDVDIMMVRDADSRIHDRDLWAIHQFINSTKKLHIIRDHRAHQRPIMGGIFGMKKGLINFNIEKTIKLFEPHHADIYQVDQNFLAHFIYPIAIKMNDYLLHGHKIAGNEILTPFPFPVVNNDFCGQVIDYKDGKPYREFEYIP